VLAMPAAAAGKALRRFRRFILMPFCLYRFVASISIAP
jgi:hypothetical protein